MDSYVEPRTRDGVSLETRQRFSQFTRQGFVDAVNNILPHSAINARWYTCMHTAYKRHPAFDAILLQIQERDPSAHIILLQEPTEHQQIVVRRFENIRADLSRIHFLPLLTHHFLMALYSLTDVVLDSVFHGGGTTSREVLEVGGPIVTLPMHVCGSRPTLAYYKLMGGFDELVANSPAECALLLCRCMALAPCRDLGAGPIAFDVLILWAGTLRSLCESRCRVPSTSSGFELASRMPRAFCFGIRARFVRGRICCSA
jgi:hypothetical protein